MRDHVPTVNVLILELVVEVLLRKAHVQVVFGSHDDHDHVLVVDLVEPRLQLPVPEATPLLGARRIRHGRGPPLLLASHGTGTRNNLSVELAAARFPPRTRS
jgi:hypothetical protein